MVLIGLIFGNINDAWILENFVSFRYMLKDNYIGIFTKTTSGRYYSIDFSTDLSSNNDLVRLGYSNDFYTWVNVWRIKNS